MKPHIRKTQTGYIVRFPGGLWIRCNSLNTVGLWIKTAKNLWQQGKRK